MEQLQAELTHLSSLQLSYSSTLSLLRTLPSRLRPAHRVPFGPLAFFPGHLSHTNELLVLLGDNLFLECTAGRAQAICERRLRVLKEKEARVKDEQQRVRERMEAGEAVLGGVDGPQLNEDGEEIVEIKEDYTEEDEKKDGMERAGNGGGDAAASSSAALAPPSAARASSGGPSTSDAALDAHWDRLAELEEEEERRERAQMRKARSDAASSSPRAPAQPSRAQPPVDAATQEQVEEDEDAVALPAIRSPADIYQTMKARKEQQGALGESSEGKREERKQKRVSFSSEQPRVAVIDPINTRPLRHHTHSPPPPASSFLPHLPSPSPSSSSSSTPPSLSPSSNPALLSAFSGAVHERPVVESAAAAPSTGTSSVDPAAPPKKMSRFMAQRLGIPFDDDD